MTALELRSQVIEAKQQFGRGEISIDDLYAVADRYIAALKEYKARTKNKKMHVPDRGYLLRAI